MSAGWFAKLVKPPLSSAVEGVMVQGRRLRLAAPSGRCSPTHLERRRETMDPSVPDERDGGRLSRFGLTGRGKPLRRLRSLEENYMVLRAASP